MSADAFTSADCFVFTNLFASIGLIITSSSASFLLPVVLNMTKPFNIRKSVISVYNITAIKTLKDIILNAGVFFLFLKKVNQYMFSIPDLTY